MKAQASTTSHGSSSSGSTFHAYYELTKPRVVALIVFTAIVGMFLSVDGMVPVSILISGALGIGLSAASGAAFNHLLDRRADQIMARTSGRPLPTGMVETTPAIVFATGLALVSMLILVAMVNTLTAVLSFASMIGYAVVYTVWLKHATPQNIVIGGAAGAMPPVLGWTAVTGEVASDALLLFLIIFCWTPPHFWALALYRQEEYAAAGNSNAARHAWPTTYAVADGALYGVAFGGECAAVRNRYVRWDVFCRRVGSGRDFPDFCGAFVSPLQ